ncbi:MAG: hypothetical protein Q9227_005935 [Pyrenula ochraceoflavens]
MSSKPDDPIPSDAPPSYEEAQASTSSTSRSTPNRIPPSHRRSMEDERRPLPSGWIRQFDPDHNHQFFVNTTSHPPRSIWHHPHDDETYLSTLPSEERERIEAEGLLRAQSKEDLAAESTDDEDNNDPTHHKQSQKPSSSSQAPEVTGTAPPKKEKLGRRLKDKLTGTTHEERERSRIQRAEQERRAYEMHMRLRQAMALAMRTGEPQFIAKDEQGRDIYIEPPSGYGGGYGGGGRYGGGGGYGVNPYVRGGGPYADPNARFIRPPGPYGRPYGSGYGAGLGLPIMGGLAGGLLLGGALGGFGG